MSDLRERIKAKLAEQVGFGGTFEDGVDAVTKVAQEAVDEMEGQWSDLADGYLGRIKEAERRAEELAGQLGVMREALHRVVSGASAEPYGCGVCGAVADKRLVIEHSVGCGLEDARKALSLPAGAASLAAHDAGVRLLETTEIFTTIDKWAGPSNQGSHKMTPDQKTGVAMVLLKLMDRMEQLRNRAESAAPSSGEGAR